MHVMEDELASPMFLLSGASPGALIGDRYRVISLLGRGGQAAVYKVADTQSSDEVFALKLLSWDGSQKSKNTSKSRFIREYTVLSQLSHPNIVKVYDLKELDDASCFFVMDCISGGSVSDRIKNRSASLTLAEIQSILLGTARALQFAHKQGIVHRDLKPGNILLTDSSEPKLVDFGLARPEKKGFTITDAGAALGTPAYMSPEQLRGEAVDQKTDIYAFGIIAFEMFARKCPFEAETYQAIAFRHQAAAIPPIVSPDGSPAPKWYQRLVQYCTEKKKEDRMESMDDIVITLEERMRKMGLLAADPAVKTPFLVRALERLFGDF